MTTMLSHQCSNGVYSTMSPHRLRFACTGRTGLLEYIDELVADYSRLNQYKAGKGDDLQLELGFWNGAAVGYDRHDVLFLKHTGFSKTGTHRWDTLARLMADGELHCQRSGYSARFLYCSSMPHHDI